MIRNFFILLSTTLFIANANLYAQGRNCSYTYDSKSTKLVWTAYKFTDKVGVDGTFDTITVSGDRKKAPSILESMHNARFSIPTSQVNSGVPDRDSKIKKYFFGSSSGAGIIKGSFRDISGGSTGTANMILTFNKKTETIPVKYVTNGNNLVVTGALDAASFGMMPGINKLNEVCKELHIGKDGVSKLWSEVDFKITSDFVETCK